MHSPDQDFEPEIAFDSRTFSDSRIARIAKDGHLLEPDVSALICASIGTANQTIIKHLAAAANLTLNPDINYSLIQGHEVRYSRYSSAEGARTRICPDLVIASDDPAKSTEALTVEVAIELKGKAAVNYITCPKGKHPEYSNQPVCYGEGCWLNTELPTANNVRYVWLAPQADNGIDGYLKNALTDDPDLQHRLGANPDAYQRQVRAMTTIWKRAHIEDLIKALAPFPELSEPIERWLKANQR